MKALYFILLYTSLTLAHAEGQQLEAELYSPKSGLSLRLYNDHFELASLLIRGDIENRRELSRGNYVFHQDTLILTGEAGQVRMLRARGAEIYEPLRFDSLTPAQPFLAWTIWYPNGNMKQTGGWASDNTKQGVWQYFDSTGKAINKQAFDHGVLVKDQFKFPWEQ